MTTHRAIFAACRELGIDNDTRKALQLQLVGKSSLTDMTEEERLKVAAHLKKRGAGKKGRRPAAPRADLRLIHVMWKALGDAGALERPDRAGLNAFIRSRFEAHWQAVPADIDMLRDHEQISDVIVALNRWIARLKLPFDISDARLGGRS